MPVQKIDGFGGLRARRYGTLEKIGEEEAAFLEVGKDFVFGLRSGGDGESGEEIASEAAERSTWGIEKLGVGIGGRSRQQEGLDMDGAETRGPFETLKASSDVLSRGKLAAAIARQKCGNSHIQKW